MAVWALNVNITDPLVVAAGSALSKSPRVKSRELWATSGSHFPDVSTFGRLHPVGRVRNVLLELRPWILDLVFGNFGGLFSLLFVHPGASRPRKSIPDGLTDLCARNESSGARLRLSFWSFSAEV